MSKHIIAKIILAILSAFYVLIVGYGYWIQSYIILSVGLSAFILTIITYCLIRSIEQTREEIIAFIESLDSNTKSKILMDQTQGE